MAFEWKSNPRQEIKNTFESNKIVGTVILFFYCRFITWHLKLETRLMTIE